MKQRDQQLIICGAGTAVALLVTSFIAGAVSVAVTVIRWGRRGS